MGEDEELEELRRRKMAQVQMQQGQQEAQIQREQEMEAQRQNILRKILTQDARERLARVRLARPDVVSSVEQQLIMLAQSGRVRGQVDDSTLKQLLAKVMPEKREIKIERR